MMWWNGGGYGMFFGPLFMILIFAATIGFVVLFVRWLGGPSPHNMPINQLPSTHAPLDILKERYAKGEINKEEFEERRRVLGV